MVSRLPKPEGLVEASLQQLGLARDYPGGRAEQAAGPGLADQRDVELRAERALAHHPGPGPVAWAASARWEGERRRAPPENSKSSC